MLSISTILGLIKSILWFVGYIKMVYIWTKSRKKCSTVTTMSLKNIYKSITIMIFYKIVFINDYIVLIFSLSFIFL